MSEAGGSQRLELALAGATATVMIAHQVAAKTARDSLFLTWFDVTVLPMMMIAGALGSAGAVLLMSRVLARHGPARLIPPIYAVSGLLFLLEWLAMAVEPRSVTLFFYLHISVLGSILISGFWSIINERYDPYRAKLAIGRLAAASTLGGLVGGLAASAVASFADARGILVMLAGMHLFCGLSLGLVARGSPRQTGQAPASFADMFEPLRQNRLIRRMTLLVLVVATNAALLDYLLKSTAARELAEEELVHFFSSFYVAVGLGGFLLQTFVGGKALRWLGIGGTMAALPAAVLAGGLFAFAVRHLMSIAALRAGAAVLNNSFFRAGFESLYTPIPAAEKRSTKLLIDVGADRSGDMVGSLLIMAILLFPRASEDLLIGTAILLGFLALTLILALQRGYVAQLARNLRDGSLRGEDITAEDATTQHTIAVTQTLVDRDRLLREIAQSREKAPGPSREAAGPARSPPGIADPVVEAILDLRSGDDARIARALTAQPVTPELLPHVVLLLARESVLREVFRALRPVASSAAGQLVDALLERRLHPLVRRRLPLVLARADNTRAVQGLVECLDDADADVRLRCGEALQRLRIENPHLTFPEPGLWQAVNAELRRLAASRGGAAAPAQVLRHLFNLLGAVYAPETLDLCYRSLLSEDAGARGTALEYLENLLPQDVREALWPLLPIDEGRKRPKRPLQEIARDLLKAGRSSGGESAPGRSDTRAAAGEDS
jgi:hypothetical protein